MALSRRREKRRGCGFAGWLPVWVIICGGCRRWIRPEGHEDTKDTKGSGVISRREPIALAPSGPARCDQAQDGRIENQAPSATVCLRALRGEKHAPIRSAAAAPAGPAAPAPCRPARRARVSSAQPSTVAASVPGSSTHSRPHHEAHHRPGGGAAAPAPPARRRPARPARTPPARRRGSGRAVAPMVFSTTASRTRCRCPAATAPGQHQRAGQQGHAAGRRQRGADPREQRGHRLQRIAHADAGDVGEGIGQHPQHRRILGRVAADGGDVGVRRRLQQARARRPGRS